MNNNTRIHRDGRVTLSAEAAHCVLRLLGEVDPDTGLSLGLNQHETEVLASVYGRIADAGIGGCDGLTPPCEVGAYRVAA